MLEIRLARGFWTSRFGLALLCAALSLLLIFAVVFSYYYIQFGRLIEQRLTGQVFQNTSRVYSVPPRVFTGESMSSRELAGYLLRAGYSENAIEGTPGEFYVKGNEIEVRPSAYSYFRGQNALRVEFKGSSIARITALPDGVPRDAVEIEPELITNLFDSSREKRRVVRYEDLPRTLVNAVLAAEDKRFFEHGGLDVVRVLGAAVADLRRGARAQGASTIDMQVARSFFFSTKREWRRKVKETIVAFELNQRFNKEQIFELYANEVYLGNRGSFAIRGFGEAAEAYFGKDIRELNLGEVAFLAGIIRAPNRYSSTERHPERAVEARDRVLAQMMEDGMITPQDAAAAKKQKLHFVSGAVDSSAAPYFVDMVKDHLLEKFSENDLASQSYRIYTTLDPDLEGAAAAAVDMGMKNVDALLARKYAKWKKAGQTVPQAQVALVAMDPQTGEIRALIGGRNYGESQLNRALARRQPGSAFKPFVYAAAFDNAVQGVQPVLTTVSTVQDEPTTFTFDGKDYTPNNFGEEFRGTVTLREALTHSLNVATVKVAEEIGYQRVVELSHQMALDPSIQATPAVALGAYEMTPVEVASGYTAFATGGTRAEPIFLRSVVGNDGTAVERFTPQTRPVLDPRVAYLVTSVMEDVINRGTGAAVRAAGFMAPAAGKTGTSHDGWFAGFTSNLLCVVWIGFDDNRDLGLSGTAAASPIWAEFMKRATALPAYRDTKDFPMPLGVVRVTIDPQSGELATPNCPTTKEEVFIAGTEPTEYCPFHGGRTLTQVPPVSWLTHLFGKSNPSTQSPSSGAGTPGSPPGSENARAPGALGPAQTPVPGQTEDQEKKKGLLDKIFGIFGGSKKPADNSNSTKPKPNPSPNP